MLDNRKHIPKYLIQMKRLFTAEANHMIDSAKGGKKEKEFEYKRN